MKKSYPLFTALFILFFSCGINAQVNTQDSLALVALYNSTDGPNWTNNTNWLTTTRIKQWYGIRLSKGRVISIGLSTNNLNGNIPSDIGNLTALTSLDLTANHNITGTIPPEIGNLKQLQYLYLYNNQLSGSIPPEIGKLKMLTELYLNGDQLSGSLPPQIGNLTNLVTADLHNNHFSDTIPAQIGNLINIQTLGLSSNNFTGPIPVQLYKLSHVYHLDLSRNQLTGTIPPRIGELTTLDFLDLSFNNLSGFIPSNLTNLSATLTFNLNNNHFTFAGMGRIDRHFSNEVYSPQATIPLTITNNVLSVSAGGILTASTYNWYKDGVLYQTLTGDSTLTTNGSGSYNVVVTNTYAPQLTLYSDTINYAGGFNATAAKLKNNTVSVSLYPNPAKTNVTLAFDAAGKYAVTITDFSGKILQTKTGISNKGTNMLKFDISGYANGLYLITINDEQNHARTLRLSKE
jgi:type IX secretion system substrate protein/Leucine Rich Repeat (LRR) protein